MFKVILWEILISSQNSLNDFFKWTLSQQLSDILPQSNPEKH